MAIATTSPVSATPPPAALAGASAQETSDRFLKLLVAQMKNQDPLNPMDNAQVTTQMAQIQTVQGVQTLNTSLHSLSGQFLQMQTLQAASLVGKQVVVPGNQLSVADGVGEGGFVLGADATAVKVEVLNPAGQVVGTMNFGAQSAGAHAFTWTAGNVDTRGAMTFRVSAVNGSNAVESTGLMQDTVTAVGNAGGNLTLQLQNAGNVPYSTVQSLN
jgi:flagellar basal-body rod modification protein FlgD